MARSLALVVILLLPALAGCLAPWHPCSSLRGGDCVIVRGVVVEVPFEDSWNASRASTAATAMGYTVFEADAFGLVALHEQWPRLIIQVGNGENATWRMRAEYDASSTRIETLSDALATAAGMRQEEQSGFLVLLSDFENRTAWRHAELPVWTPILAAA